ncbi:MAG: NADH-quinone oxidoreductase subunit L [Acidiphilium sp.]|nr:NADH-quinone oxidoreductase subunit L [Acidiphilium sp.]MDD4936572.1 NADH-quinone oxidoreductase subunit L [Acidiphilium sp.]
MNNLLWLVPTLPLLGALLLGLFGAVLPAWCTALIGTASVGIAAIIASSIGIHWYGNAPASHVFVQDLWSWIDLPHLSIGLSLYLDPVSLLMMLVITTVGFLIHLFSTEYMAGDEGYSRYFVYLNLFVAAMLLLVLASDLLVMFVGWEGVGVCSYLLVGFWFHKPANGYAARKSFVVTRIADIAMLVGILLLAVKLGTLSIQPMLARAVEVWPHGDVWPSLAAGLLLIGGLGKSAQVPFQTWLPDAMAGPTPVSALIHAATMVTAGVYLIVRTHVLFLLAPDVLMAISIGAAITLLLAALAALVQSDIKRVLAYSTISQIGYMFLAVGVGAWSAAMFHFLTHAVFKALLFLSAGAIAMRLHHEQNIFKMGGLRNKIPLAFWSFLIGSASLAALPVVSAGSFSKEMILGSVWFDPTIGPLLWGAGLLGALITATYISRVVFLVFFGPVRTEVSGRYGVRIAVPLIVLAAGSMLVGWLETPGFLGGNRMVTVLLRPAVGAVGIHPAMDILADASGYIAPLLGVAIAFTLYRSGYWQRAATAQPNALRRLMHSGFGFDAVYDVILVRPFMALVRGLRNDPVDLVITGISVLAIRLHRALRRSQVGQVRRYAGWVMVGSIATVAILVFA